MPKKDAEPILKVTDEMISAAKFCAAMGTTIDQFAALMGVSASSIKKYIVPHVRDEIARRPKAGITADEKHKIEQAAATGMADNEIARLMKIDARLLRAHCQEQLDAGRSNVLLNVGAAVVSQALKGCRQSQQRVLSRFSDWKTPLIEFSHQTPAVNGSAEKLGELPEDEQDRIIEDMIAQKVLEHGSITVGEAN